MVKDQMSASAPPNPFLDPGDGHVLADDAEKERQAAQAAVTPNPQPNPFPGSGDLDSERGPGVRDDAARPDRPNHKR
jgi:hypothetical protein